MVNIPADEKEPKTRPREKRNEKAGIEEKEKTQSSQMRYPNADDIYER
ncbi:hypothetical protein L1765_13895 [Microaerobacter geothermalis]|nr:hypothetical protein [Microaerobacter geothermalis]MCF6095051.1 hypothetical protein [Microaerobacter geothermalis]